MREISVDKIINAVCRLCIKANVVLPAETCALIDRACQTEKSASARKILELLRENHILAKAENIPICQDTGMAVVFAEIGQDIHITDGSFEDAINEGVRRGYEKGFLRKSVVADPLRRVNTGDNTPAVIHTRIVPGDKLRISVAPKGFGSENMSAMKMFLPSATADDVLDFVIETVQNAGANPCPPIIVGVGLGGTSEIAALLAKKALLRPEGKPNADELYAGLEKEALAKINALGIGPQGFGGETTALAVYFETYPTHIAGLPCVVNLGCHVTRHAEAIL